MHHAAVATLFDHPVGGLWITETAGALTGTFDGAAAPVAFELSTDGELRRVVLRDARGNLLVESTLADGIETSTYLGRLTIYGRPRDTNPRVIGDRTAMAELALRPEAGALLALRDALAEHGLARELFAAPRPEMAPRYLAPGEHVTIATWSWWWSTMIDLWSWDGPARYQLEDGFGPLADTVEGSRRCAQAWSWWTVKVTNLYSSDVLGVDAPHR